MRSRDGRWLLAVALVASAACTGGDDDATPSATTETSAAEAATTTEPATSPTDGPLGPFGDPGPAHELFYRVERLQTGLVDTERRLAQHPFDVRVETWAGEPADVDPAASPRLLDLEVLGGAETGAIDQERVLVVIPPRVALRSGHLGTDVDGAVAAGVLEPLGMGRTIVGRDCVELRTGAPLDGGILRPPTGTDHNDLCVDQHGLVLREEITTSGAVVERRTAVAVDQQPTVAADAFEPLGWRIPEENGGGRVRRVTADSRPPGVDHHELPTAPPGTDLLGRFGVLTDTAPAPGPAGPVDQVISMVDAYVGGAEVLTIENGASIGGGAVLGRGDVDVPLSFAPDATAVFLTTGVELRVPLPEGRFLRLTATMSIDELVSLAESLEVVAGPGDVVAFDDEPDITGRLDPGDEANDN